MATPSRFVDIGRALECFSAPASTRDAPGPRDWASCVLRGCEGAVLEVALEQAGRAVVQDVEAFRNGVTELAPPNEGIEKCNEDSCAAYAQGIEKALSTLHAGVRQRDAQLGLLAQEMLAREDADPLDVAPAATIAQQFRYRVFTELTRPGTISLGAVLQSYLQAKLLLFGHAMAAHVRGLVATDMADSDDDDGDDTASLPILPFGARGVPAACDLPDVGELLGAAFREGLSAAAVALEAVGASEVLRDAASSAVATHLAGVLADEGGVRGEFGQHALEPLRRYARAVVVPLLNACGVDASSRVRAAGTGDALSWVHMHIYESLGRLRMQQAFDLVVDFPDSRPALEDLGECLRETSLHTLLAQTLRQQLSARLLIPGADTSLIITKWLDAARAIAVADPSGATVEALGHPVRAYLRTQRKDTVRCLVGLLTEDGEEGGGAALQGALAASSAAPGGGANAAAADRSSGATALKEAREWEPAPAHVAPGRSVSLGAADLLAGLYGSRDRLVGHYQSVLAEKLLGRSDWDTDHEIRTVELLKLQLGEDSMQACEVMLKDVADSRRIAALVGGRLEAAGAGRCAPGEPRVQATVVSALYWPALAEEGIQLPGDVKEQLDVYAQLYHKVKAPRKLVWKPNLGQVQLEVTTARGGTTSVTVTPQQAAIVLAFRRQARWPLAQLAKEVGMDEETVRRKAAVWVSQGVLREAPGALERGDGAAPDDGAGGMDVDGAGAHGGDAGGGAVQSEEERARAEMGMYQQYIVGMLTNFDGLPLARIHNMLKMFVMDAKFDKSEEQLAAFLGALVSDGVLRKEGDEYHLA
ncbi:unnamed protein product [Pedinophyceae sp. YPF-701]|nr:unnamed protein product [Pedinophyceae sp. YPF-701]